MPSPESAIQILNWSPSRPIVMSMRPPSGVYLKALESTLNTTLSSFSWSIHTLGNPGSTCNEKRIFFSSAMLSNDEDTSRKKCSTSVGAANSRT